VKLAVPTTRSQTQSSDDDDEVSSDRYDDDADLDLDTRQLPSFDTAGSPLRSVHPPTVGSDRSVLARQGEDHRVSRLYGAVPATCACVLLSVTVLGLLLLVRRYRRRSNDRRHKSAVNAAFLPSSCPSVSSPAPHHHHSAIQLPPSREPYICLHCSRPDLQRASLGAYSSPAET